MNGVQEAASSNLATPTKKALYYKAFYFCIITFYFSCRRFVDDRLFLGFLDFFNNRAILLRINHPYSLHMLVHNSKNFRNLRA